MNTPANPQETFELRLRTLRTLWFALFMSIALYYGLTLFVGPREEIEYQPMVPMILGAIALSTTLVSFPIKSKLITRAIELQQVPMVQQAYIVAWALCETSALLGLLIFFLTGNRYYYIPFIIGALGQLLHLPRREHVVNASSKTPIV